MQPPTPLSGKNISVPGTCVTMLIIVCLEEEGSNLDESNESK